MGSSHPTGLTVSPAELLVPVAAVGAFNNPQNVVVNFTILQPVLSLSASIVNLTVAAGGTAGPQVVNVTNSGAGTLASLGTIACAPSAARVDCAVNQGAGTLSLTVNTATGADRGAIRLQRVGHRTEHGQRGANGDNRAYCNA